MTPRRDLTFDGARLRAERRAAGYTLVELSALVLCSRQTLNAYETGRHRPAPAVVERLARALRIKVEALRQPTEET